MVNARQNYSDSQLFIRLEELQGCTKGTNHKYYIDHDHIQDTGEVGPNMKNNIRQISERDVLISMTRIPSESGINI